MTEDLPKGWVKTTLGEVCAMNPRPAFEELPPNETEVSFVPMAAVEEETGRLDASDSRPLSSVRKGYTPFRENDVIFAKITPCMENGKIALATGLKNGLAYGSTEFFVFRPDDGVLPRFVLHFLLQPTLRHEAQRRMTGAVGQKRVPSNYLATYPIPLPPTREQERIVTKLDTMLSRIAAGEAAARRALDRLDRYRAAVLQAAVTGELTREWRQSQKPDETGTRLLRRLLKERRARWEQTEFQRLRDAGETPKNDRWKLRYPEPIPPITPDNVRVPRGWAWASLDQCFVVERGKFSVRPRNDPAYYGGPHPFVQIGSLPHDGGLITEFSQTLNDKGLAVSKKFRRGTILVAIVGATIANTGVLGFDACCPDSLVAVQADDETLRGYADVWLRANKLKLRALAIASGGQPNINLGILQPFSIAIPPAAEQAEIVREVERRLSAANQLLAKLSRQVDHAHAARQALFMDAFAGRLVPQASDDEPAAVLLARIRAARKANADKPKGKRMPKSNIAPARRPLLDVLREYKRPMTPDQLFLASGFEHDFKIAKPAKAQEVIDRFYEELRQLTAEPPQIKQTTSGSHLVALRAIS